MAEVLHVNSQEFEYVIAQNDVEHPEVKVVKVDVDQEPSLAMQFGVQSIPTLITFKKGQAVNRQLGFVPYETLENMLK